MRCETTQTERKGEVNVVIIVIFVNIDHIRGADHGRLLVGEKNDQNISTNNKTCGTKHSNIYSFFVDIFCEDQI